ncbi:MAG: CoA-acylating methylmalonate-semialdehyde dehydrogenase [Candidatus Poribacteria bacterium]|nr:CoA-acylating methylmalonate-semialdehyde dehydrogenase [Candidatus Poribacteria bacterium]MDE0505824.1 CoA-acylating methylmalonate-semialdehyde dehydrogenase [Candidatus Poribacteria bacterium]
MSAEIMLQNYINNEWITPDNDESLEVTNPATTGVLARVPLSPAAEVDIAAGAAASALDDWRHTPPTERIQYLFKLKQLLEDNLDDISRTITMESGKTLTEAKGEMRRAIENVEVACGIPTMMQGTNLEDIASGIDEFMIRQPVGVCAAIAPFNFPGMITFWFLPYAIACGNTYIVKPSEKVPITMQKVFRLLEQTGLPKGVVNLVNGAADTVNAIIDHPTIRAISFVGATATAKYVYARATANGKRAQCQGGAKNPILVLPDADEEEVIHAVGESAFGCAGQRCLAASLVVTVGGAKGWFSKSIADAAASRPVGYGLDEGVEMGPVITGESKTRIEGLIQQGADEGADVLVDGRHPLISGFENGNFVRPTVLQNLNPAGDIASTEIFGPVLGLIHTDTVDDAIRLINSGKYGNMACLFTSSGAAARKFRYEAQIGNIGINVGVAAPMAFFPFSGWKESFFGDLHGQAGDAIDFFTQKKVVVERWF